MSDPYRDRQILRIDEVSDYINRLVEPADLPEPLIVGGCKWWRKQDIDDWLDAQRGPGGDQSQEAS